MPVPHPEPRIDTQLIHAGEPRPRIGGAVVTPIFQSATFEVAGKDGYHDLRYIRLNNTPNHVSLHAKLAALEGAEAALVAASGMAAISTALLTVLRPGDRLLAQDCLYGGTHGLAAHDLAELGIGLDLVPGDDPDAWEAALRPETRAFLVEALSNPLLQVPALEEAAEFARAKGLVSMIDSTFATPVNLRPHALGFDVVLHSATKYLNGHSDLVAGAITGSRDLVDRARRKLNHLGGTLDPHACFLLSRGMKTLGVRMARHNESALRIAHHLEQHPAVRRVHYPGLPGHPGHARAARLFAGFGGMLSFEHAGGVEAAARAVERTELFVHAPSLGGVESLVTRPATTSHVGLSPEERARSGVTDELIRLSVGIEDVEDLIADLDRALG